MLRVHAAFTHRLRLVAARMAVGIHSPTNAMMVSLAAKAIDDLAAKYSDVRAERDAARAELKANCDGWLP